MGSFMSGSEEPDPEHDQQVEELKERIKAFEDDARKMGVYMEGFVTGDLPPYDRDQLDDDIPEGATQFFLGTFLVGEQAFTDRVMRPDKYEEDTKFRHAVGTIDPADEIRRKMQRNIEEGKDPFAD